MAWYCTNMHSRIYVQTKVTNSYADISRQKLYLPSVYLSEHLLSSTRPYPSLVCAAARTEPTSAPLHVRRQEASGRYRRRWRHWVSVRPGTRREMAFQSLAPRSSTAPRRASSWGGGARDGRSARRRGARHARDRCRPALSRAWP